jgi:surface antigen
LTNIAQYQELVSPGGTISIHVGCGKQGVTGWVSDNHSLAVSVGSATRVLNVLCNDGVSTGAGIRCTYPTLGRTRGSNPGVAGNCTWEASQLMFGAIGGFPGWGGDARYWASNASAAGWNISKVPMVNSIFVFQPGHGTSSSAGHVGWVTYVSPNGQSFQATEMNVSGLFSLVRGRTHTYDATTQFVLIPPAYPVS